jgi:tetratricopeptide (TPR) repeat protein
MLDAGSSPPIGKIVPDYELLRRVGRGSYGEVFLARNLTGSFVAVKVVARSTFDHDRPFEREFEGIKSFEPVSRSDPSQVAIFHVGQGDGFFYYAMELADDWTTECPARDAQLYCPHTLREDIKRRGHLPVSECVEIGLALTRALAHLHHHGLVHRDVKPSNVIFVAGVPKLADIGLMTSIDSTRSLVGTDGYAAPEGPGTPQADLYSLGKLLYEISTGCDRKQFPALPPDITDRLDRDALIELNAIIMRACQFDPRQRHANAEAMRMELELLQRGQSVQRKQTLQRWRVIFKKAGMATVIIGAFAAILGLLFPALSTSDRFPDGPPSTNEAANALCAKALLILRGDNHNAFTEAYTNLHRAIDLDPNFARPYVGLFELRGRERPPSLPATTLEEMRTINRRLKELAPNLGVTYCCQSLVDYEDLNFPNALDNARRATRADPNYELGHLFYAFVLLNFDRPVEARKEAQIARTIAPSKAAVYRVLGHTYYVQRDFTNAIAMYRQAIEWQPHEVARIFIGRAYRAMGDYTNSLGYLEDSEIYGGADEKLTKNGYAMLREALDTGGIRGYWQQHWKWEAPQTNVNYYWKAAIQIHLGNTNAALDWLEKSYQSRERDGYETDLTYLIYDEYWDGLRDNPRFKKLLDAIGYSKVMPASRR